MEEIRISGQLVDVVARSIRPATITISGTKIKSVEYVGEAPNVYLIPGFVDAHIHIESSMLLPAEFARQSVVHGTVACVCDPHEIANVCGVEGIDYMIKNGKQSPLKFYFGAPSCVPATEFDSAGAVLDASKVDELLARDDIYFLAEMMNYPGVIEQDAQVHAKLAAARKYHKPIDGHAPELTGEGLKAYAAAGISTDHECMTTAEAEEKIALGMQILIREGSAAKNFDDLLPLMKNFADRIMFCSDDKHPDDLLKNGHINTLARRAVAAGYNPVDVLRVCSYNPVKHYGLNVGLLQTGDEADFVIVDDLKDFRINEVYIAGRKVVAAGNALFNVVEGETVINNFQAEKITVADIHVAPEGNSLKVIVVDDGQLFTHSHRVAPRTVEGNVVSDVQQDVLKLVVYNRYRPSKPAVGFIRNIGLKAGAMASTVSHDSHNIVAVGASDAEIVRAINSLIDTKGGVLACNGDEMKILPLPVAGLISVKNGEETARLYEEVDAMAKRLGSTLKAPFMTLAFMSLLVIPKLKLSDKGLFDGRSYSFIALMDEVDDQ
ncbi:MAG: adenine deaminase [Paludibacter sp.]|jgi:adenine deaminase|nr:adenine deaminase [Paludibacter sp.]